RLADEAAGVDDDDLRGLRVVDDREIALLGDAQHDLAVDAVLRAAEADEMDRLRELRHLGPVQIARVHVRSTVLQRARNLRPNGRPATHLARGMRPSKAAQKQVTSSLLAFGVPSKPA